MAINRPDAFMELLKTIGTSHFSSEMIDNSQLLQDKQSQIKSMEEMHSRPDNGWDK
jgi:hypothetical protein